MPNNKVFTQEELDRLREEYEIEEDYRHYVSALPDGEIDIELDPIAHPEFMSEDYRTRRRTIFKNAFRGAETDPDLGF